MKINADDPPPSAAVTRSAWRRVRRWIKGSVAKARRAPDQIVNTADVTPRLVPTS